MARQVIHREGLDAMTRVELIKRLAATIDGLTAVQAKVLVDTIFEMIKHTLECGDTIKIPGFGKFVPQERQPRRGRNPATGARITIPARRVVVFKASRKLKDALNS